MSDKFFCKKPGGYRVKDGGGEVRVHLLEGTADKGPWYHAWQYSDEQVEKWLEDGIIEFVEAPCPVKDTK